MFDVFKFNSKPINRTQYWWYSLLIMVVTFICTILITQTLPSSGGGEIQIIAVMLLCVMSITIQILLIYKRTKSIGLHGVFTLIALIPFVGIGYTVLVLGFKPPKPWYCHVHGDPSKT